MSWDRAGRWVGVALVAEPLLACGEPAAGPLASGESTAGPEPLLAGDILTPLPGSPPVGRPRVAGVTRTVFLNFGGGKLVKASVDNAALNASPYFSGTVPAFVGDAATIALVVAAVRKLFGRYDVEFVTARPTTGAYDMVLVGGTCANAGYCAGLDPTKVGGLGPLDCGDKSDRNLALAFSEVMRAAVQAWGNEAYADWVAVAIAHELGHTFGLPHTAQSGAAACDLMSYGTCYDTTTAINHKSFLDQPLGLAPDSAGQCGMSTVNPHQVLLVALGPDKKKPELTITSPAEGAKLGTNVALSATVADSGAVSVELIVDGASHSTLTAPPYTWSLTLPLGPHTLTLHASDEMKNTATATRTIEVSRPPAVLGETCEKAADCASALCIVSPEGQKFCSETCSLASETCPSGYRCVASSGGSAICAPAPAGAPTTPTSPASPTSPTNSSASGPISPGESLWVGGCSTAAGRCDDGALGVLGLALALLATRRRAATTRTTSSPCTGSGRSRPRPRRRCA